MKKRKKIKNTEDWRQNKKTGRMERTELWNDGRLSEEEYRRQNKPEDRLEKTATFAL